MKGFVIAFVLVFGINFSTHAQARIAIEGGVNESTVLETSNQPNFSNLKNGYLPRVGFHIGFMADLPLAPKSKFYFQPCIEFSNKGRKFSQSNKAGDTATTATQFVNYIDLPLDFVYKFALAKKVALIVGLGPYLSFFYSGQESSTTIGPNNYYTSTSTSNLNTGTGPGKYTTFDYGMDVLTGVYLGGSFITANYSRGLQNFYQDPTYAGSFKNQVIGLTLGIYLNERKKKKADLPKDDTEDADCDSVLDKVDQCPTVAGLKKYNGCPIPDSDCDSINDEEDKCPFVAGFRRYNGCPIPDTDGDSVNDEVDRCPTVAGLPQYKGCPIPIDETLAADNVNGDTMSYYIYYDPNKISINRKGLVTLNKIRQLLKENKTLHIKISGYSDKNNQKKTAKEQSAERAITVKNYLVNSNLPGGRMKIYYWGATRPLVNKKNKIEQWKNRRVEIAVYQKKPKPVVANAEQYVASGNKIVGKNKKAVGRKKNINDSAIAVTDNKAYINVYDNPRASDSTVTNDTVMGSRLNILVKGNVAATTKKAPTTNDNQEVASSNNEGDTALNKNTIGESNKQQVNNNNNLNDTVTGGHLNILVKGNVNDSTLFADNKTNNEKVIAKNNDQQASNNNDNDSTTVNGTTLHILVKGKTTYKNKKAARVNNNQEVTNDNNATDTIALNNGNANKKHKQIINTNNNSTSATHKKAENNNRANDWQAIITPNNVTDTATNNNKIAEKAIARKNNQEVANKEIADTLNNNKARQNKNRNAIIEKNNREIIAENGIDTNSIEQTITTKPPSQINDTDKVLDCYTIYFDPNQVILNSASFDILDHIREILKSDSNLYIGISGYSERIGSETSAQKLSQERAFLTRDYMNSYGVLIDRIRVSYWGSKIPVADDSDPYQQWENRRVEICIYEYPQ
jgi:OOP family OmpA-OmpF porin